MNFKKLLSAVVAGTMVLGTMTFSVFADGEGTEATETNYIENGIYYRENVTRSESGFSNQSPSKTTYFCANGIPITVSDRENGVKGSTVSWTYDNTTYSKDLPANAIIVGGGWDNPVEDGTSITINGGEIDYGVFGGGVKAAATVTGDVNITVNNGEFNDGIVGGGINGNVGTAYNPSNITVTIGTADTKPYIAQNIVGGGFNGDVYGKITLNINNATVLFNTSYPGASDSFVVGAGVDGDVYGEINVTVTDGLIDGTVAGGSMRTGNVYGDINVKVSGGELTDLAGGGLGVFLYGSTPGTITGNTNVNVSGGTITDTVNGGSAYYGGNIKGNSTVTITDGTIGQDSPYSGRSYGIYGGCGSANGTVTGTSSVSIKGGNIKKTSETIVAGSSTDTTAKEGDSIEITGGSFAFNPTKYCSLGYYGADKEGDGTYEVYPTKTEVIDNASSGGIKIGLPELKTSDIIDYSKDYTYKVVVSEVSATDKEKVDEVLSSGPAKDKDAAYFDVKVVKTDSDGVEEEVHATDQTVTLTLNKKATSKDNIHIYHITDTTVPVTNFELGDDMQTVTFTATSFSAYVVLFDADETAVEATENAAIKFVKKSDNLYDIVAQATDGKVFNRLMTADLTFKNDTTDAVSYTVKPAAYINLIDAGNGRYEFNFNGVNHADAVGAEITIGSVEFEGYGTGTFSVDAAAATNVLHTATESNNIVRDYTAGGTIYKLNLTDSQAAYEITVPQNTLTVNVRFNNKITDHEKAYQDMKAVISGGDLTGDITVDFGTNATALDSDAYSFTQKLTKNRTYTVTISGAGYRTARYTVTMNADKTLSFWNNANDNKQLVETVTGTTPSDEDIAANGVTKNFLAGDIVKDNNINIYDLSAVVSYFGETGLVNANGDANSHTRYDLNRDGVIDSKDVAYVLVSWDK